MTDSRGPNVSAGFPIRGWFADSDAEFRRELLALARPKSCAAGSVIYQADEVGQDVFGISSGVVVFQSRLTHPDAVLLHMLRPGEWFGTVSLLLERGRRVTAVARTDVNLLRVPGDELRALLGNSTGNTFLVENGILKSYLHDRISSKHYDVNPTGSGRRESLRHIPQPRMRNTYMLPGPHKKDEIISSVKKGIFAETFTNGQVIIGAGDFTFYVKSGFLIEDGKLSKPIKDINIIGNGPQVLKDIVMVADDFERAEGGWTCGKNGQGVPVSMGLPTVKVSKMTVGGVNS